MSADELRETAVDLALTRFDRDGVEGLPKTLDPPPKRINLDWTTLPVTSSVENEVAKFVVQRGEYGWMNDHDVSALAKTLEDGEFEMSVDQALSLRKAILQQKSVYRHGRMMREAERLLRDYDKGQGIIAIARNRDYPPLNVMRAIFSARRWSKKRIKEAMKDPDRRLKGRDLKEYREAEEQDRISSADQSETHDRSARFETVLADHLALRVATPVRDHRVELAAAPRHEDIVRSLRDHAPLPLLVVDPPSPSSPAPSSSLGSSPSESKPAST